MVGRPITSRSSQHQEHGPGLERQNGLKYLLSVAVVVAVAQYQADLPEVLVAAVVVGLLLIGKPYLFPHPSR